MVTNNILYGDLPKLTDKIRERRLKSQASWTLHATVTLSLKLTS